MGLNITSYKLPFVEFCHKSGLQLHIEACEDKVEQTMICELP